MSLTQMSVSTNDPPYLMSGGTNSSFLDQNQTLMEESVLSNAYLVNKRVSTPALQT